MQCEEENAVAGEVVCGRLLNQKTLGSAKLNDSEAVPRADLVLHAVEMILYGLLRKAEVIGNLFVRKPLSDERNNLLLAPGKPEPVVHSR